MKSFWSFIIIFFTCFFALIWLSTLDTWFDSHDTAADIILFILTFNFLVWLGVCCYWHKLKQFGWGKYILASCLGVVFIAALFDSLINWSYDRLINNYETVRFDVALQDKTLYAAAHAQPLAGSMQLAAQHDCAQSTLCTIYIITKPVELNLPFTQLTFENFTALTETQYLPELVNLLDKKPSDVSDYNDYEALAKLLAAQLESRYPEQSVLVLIAWRNTDNYNPCENVPENVQAECWRYDVIKHSTDFTFVPGFDDEVRFLGPEPLHKNLSEPDLWMHYFIHRLKLYAYILAYPF